MPLIKEVNENKDKLHQLGNRVVTLTGSKYKCIKTTLSTSEKAFINLLVSNDSILKPTGKINEEIGLQLPYWDSQDYKVPILPYESIFEVLDNSNNVALCFNVLIHDSVTLLESEDNEVQKVFIDWCYQVLELKFDLQFFFNRWEGKIMKNLKFKTFNDTEDETLEFILDEEEENSDEDSEMKNIIVSKALLEEEDEARSDEFIIKGFGHTEEPLKKGLIQEIGIGESKAGYELKLQENNTKSSKTDNAFSSDLNF